MTLASLLVPPFVPPFVPPLARPFDAPTAFIDAGQGRLAYYRHGSGPDVVAAHGWPLHSETYRNLLPYLERDFTVHMFDFPGTGRTEWPHATSLEIYREALERGIEAVGLTRYALLAHDSGGVVARMVAARDPRVAGLVLCGSEIPGHHPLLLKAFIAAAKAGLTSTVMSMLRVGPIRRSILGFGACFTDPAYADGDFGDIFFRPLTKDRALVKWQESLLQSFTFDDVDALAEVHGRIEAPTLCIWGDRDPYFPIDKARAMLPQFKGGARLEVIPGARLFPHEDRPEEFAAYAKPFLARCLGLSSRAVVGVSAAAPQRAAS